MSASADASRSPLREAIAHRQGLVKGDEVGVSTTRRRKPRRLVLEAVSHLEHLAHAGRGHAPRTAPDSSLAGRT